MCEFRFAKLTPEKPLTDLKNPYFALRNRGFSREIPIGKAFIPMGTTRKKDPCFRYISSSVMEFSLGVSKYFERPWWAFSQKT